MSPSTDLIPSPQPRSRWRRWLLWVFLGLLIFISIPFGKELYSRQQAQSDLDSTIAYVDRLDPGWRLEDIEAARRQVPADRNSATIVVAAANLLPKKGIPVITEELANIPPPAGLRQDQADRLAAALKPLEYQALQKVDEHFVDRVRKDDESLTLARLLFPAIGKIAQAEKRLQVQLACAVAGLGAERFRRRHQRWPRSLDELGKSGFLKEVPFDLVDGKPLRFRRTKNGVVFISILAPDPVARKILDEKPDEPIDLDKLPFDSISRVEFRLWDVSRRRKAPPALKAGE